MINKLENGFMLGQFLLCYATLKPKCGSEGISNLENWQNDGHEISWSYEHIHSLMYIT